jgi:hypothetical protein
MKDTKPPVGIGALEVPGGGDCEKALDLVLAGIHSDVESAISHNASCEGRVGEL